MSRGVLFALLQTVVAMMIGIVVMGDEVTLPLIAGALMCLSGALLAKICFGAKADAA